MATSGTISFTLDNAEIIETAAELAGAEITSAEDLKKARQAINLVLMDMQNKGHHLAKLTNNTFTTVSASASYTLSAGVIDVLDAVVVRSSVATPLERISLFEYHKIPTKTQKGLPTQFTVDRNKDNITIHLYQTPDKSTDTIDYWCVTQIEDAGAYNNNPDIHERYLNALIFGTAYFLLLKKPQPTEFDIQTRAEMRELYMGSLTEAAIDDRERASMRITPWPYRR